MLPCFSNLRKVGPEYSNMLHTPSDSPSQASHFPKTTSKMEVEFEATPISSDYLVYQAIGVGCFGAASIFLSRHVPSKVFTVLRLIDLERLSSSQMDDVQNEMKLSQLINHSHVARYLCSFVVGTKLWALQPLMHYGSCADIMHSAQPFRNGFKEPVISIILRDIVSGLQYLHSLGFVHRSIRAKHFLIHEDGIVKLSGLRSVVSMIEDGARVKALHGHFTGTVDNICWLAPELLSQDLSGYSFQSDVYSVGIAALELATGEAPFAGLPVTEVIPLLSPCFLWHPNFLIGSFRACARTASEIMMLKLRGHPPVLMKKGDGEKEGQISSHLSKVIDLCVDPDPSRRPSPAKLLNTSLLKVRKKFAPNTLKDLLLPVVPLDTTKLNVAETGLESLFEAMTTTENIWT